MEKVADLDNLYLAYLKARRGKRDSESVREYEKNLHESIAKLRDQFLNGTVPVGDYSYFKIFDPKERLICAAPFPERVMHHALMNILHPYFDRHLIPDTYATRIGKGVYAALSRAMYGMKSCRYVAKLDVRKYFDSIHHDVLKAKLRRMFKDPALLSLMDKIIDSYEVLPNQGLPIGNLTSQYFANHYLSRLDHWLVDVVRVPVYVRYMDDILVFGDSREELLSLVRQIRSVVREQECLEFKPELLHPTSLGIPFLGYKLFPNRLLLNGRSKRRFKEKLKLYNSLLSKGMWSQQDYYEHITPLCSFVQKADSIQFRRNVLKTVG